MQLKNWRIWLEHLGFLPSRSIRRIPKLRNAWSFESERLESRALLSATCPTDFVADPIVADVAPVSRKTQVTFPNVAGTWTVDTTSEYFGSGTLTMTQNGKTVTSTVTFEDLPTFTTKATFKKHTPNELSSKSPRIEVPGSQVLVKLKILLTFPQGNQSPTTFTGTVNAPVIPKPLLPPPLASLAGTKSNPQPIVANSLQASGQSELPPLLASEVNRSSAADHSVTQVSRKAQAVQFPTVSKTWTVVANSQYFGNGTVTMVQNGRKVTSTVAMEDLPTFTTQATFKRKSANVLTSKSPRIEVPEIPVDIRATIIITFPSGNLNPNSFTGDVRIPFFGSVGTLVGTKQP